MSNKKTWISPFLKQCFVTGAVGVNIIGHGCVLGFPAILLPQLEQPGSPIALTRDQGSWIASIVGIVMLIGAIIIMPLMKSCSRKSAHYAATAPVIAGWVITIFSTNFLGLFIGRALCGISFGMLNSLRSILIAEYTSPKNRGAFLTTVALTQAFGIFFVHLIGSFLSWKNTAIISVFFSVLSLVMTFFSPESPSCLAAEGRYDECRVAFRWLRGDSEDAELEAMIRARILEKNLKETRTVSKNRLKSLRATIMKKEFYKPNIIMCHLSCLLQFAGGTTMASYSTVILSLLMGPNANVHFWMIFLDTQRIIFNTAAVFVINKTKRRTMLFSIGTLSVISHIALAAYVMATKDVNPKSIWLPAILINVQIFTVAVVMLPLPYVIAGEVFPLEYKGIGGMISMVAQSASMFGVLKTFPGLIENVGLDGTYLVYAAILAYNLVVVWFFLPETMGKTLQEIEDEFRGRPLAPEEVEARKSIQAETSIELQELKRRESDLKSVPLFLS